MKIKNIEAKWIHVPIPERPGLGITVDEDFVKQYAVE